MAADDHLSDEDIRAAARHWLSLPGWQETLARGIDAKLPGDLRREADDIPRRLLELATDEEAGITPLWARRHEVDAALRVAGYPEPSDMSVLDRTADVLMDLIRQHVEKRMQAVFRPEEVHLSAPPPPAPHTPTALMKTPRVSDHLEEWHSALIEGWHHVKAIDPHSANQYRVAARLFMEIIGDRCFGDITHEDGEKFRDQLLRLPSSHGKGRHVHALEAISMADARGAERVSMKTAKRHNTAMNRYWEWLLYTGLIPRSPSPFTKHKFPGAKSSSQDRDAWTAEQLEHILKSSDFLSHPQDGAYHWLPLISLHSGMRLEEICRLRPAEDIQTINGIACFVIQKHPDGWDPKTEAGARRVPIHPWLIDHGLMKLVHERRQQGARRLFPELPLQGIKLGAQYSRDFSRFKIALGYGKKNVFHSFRHTFRTELEDTSHKDSHINAVMGHEGAREERDAPT